MNAEAHKAIGELEGLLNMQLFSYAMTGAALRNLKVLRHKATGVQAVGGNELKAQTLMQLADRLEALIRAGHGIDTAMKTMRAEGWITRMNNFEMRDEQ